MHPYSLDISVHRRSKDEMRHTIFHSISRTWYGFSPHYRYMHSRQGNYQPQIGNSLLYGVTALLYGVLTCMGHSYCSGLVNFHVKETKVLALAQTQSTWEKYKYCFKLLSIHNLHQASFRWQTLQFEVCRKLDVSSLNGSACMITTR